MNHAPAKPHQTKNEPHQTPRLLSEGIHEANATAATPSLRRRLTVIGVLIAASCLAIGVSRAGEPTQTDSESVFETSNPSSTGDATRSALLDGPEFGELVAEVSRINNPTEPLSILLDGPAFEEAVDEALQESSRPSTEATVPAGVR